MRHQVFWNAMLCDCVFGSGRFETVYSFRNVGKPTPSNAGSHTRQSDTSRRSVYFEVRNGSFKFMISVLGTVKITIL